MFKRENASEGDDPNKAVATDGIWPLGIWWDSLAARLMDHLFRDGEVFEITVRILCP